MNSLLVIILVLIFLCLDSSQLFFHCYNYLLTCPLSCTYFYLTNLYKGHNRNKLDCPHFFVMHFVLTASQRNSGSVLLRFTKIPGVFQVFSRLILNFPGVKTIPILSIADRISYKYVCYLS